MTIFVTRSIKKCICGKEAGTTKFTDFAQARTVLLLIGILVLGDMFFAPEAVDLKTSNWIVSQWPVSAYYLVGAIWLLITSMFFIKGHKIICAMRKALLLLA